MKGAEMKDETYEPPMITVLGEVTDLTQAKPGFYFDFPGSAEGNAVPPTVGSLGTGTS
jgi:hypothetical protein